jgi:SecA DEAD-like domain
VGTAEQEQEKLTYITPGLTAARSELQARLRIMKLLTDGCSPTLSVLRIPPCSRAHGLVAAWQPDSSAELKYLRVTVTRTSLNFTHQVTICCSGASCAAALSRICCQITCCNLQLNTRMQIGSFAPPTPGCLPRLQQTCASTACQTACHTRRAVPLSQQSNHCNAFRQSCMQQRSGRRSSRGSKAIVPQALFQNMFKSDEGGKTRKKYQQRVDRINGMESKYEQMDDEELKRQTEALRSRVAKGEALESVLPEAFAVSRDSHASQDSVSRLWSA